MDVTSWVSAGGATASALAALVAVRAASHSHRNAIASERAAAAAEEQSRSTARATEVAEATFRAITSQGYQPRWEFEGFWTVQPYPIDTGGPKTAAERAAFAVRVREVAQQNARDLERRQQYALMNRTGETAWAAEWTADTEDFLDDRERDQVREPRNVDPNRSLLVTEWRPYKVTEIVVNWYRSKDLAPGSKQQWRGTIPMTRR